MDEPFIPELDVPVIFRSRPVSVPGDLRPVWRISLLVLLLKKCCSGGRSSLRRLHVLSWAARSPKSATSLLDALDELRPPDAVIVRIEPALNQAVDFAIGEGLVTRGSKDRVQLEDAGKELADMLEANEEVLIREKRFMGQVRFKMTESFVSSMFDYGISL